MFLNRSHPRFDMAMEVLCTLPKYPYSVPVAELVSDFGMRVKSDMSQIFNMLKGRGFRVETHNADSAAGDVGRQVCIMQDGWVAAQIRGGEYWREVNS